MELTVKHEGHRETEKVIVDLSESGFRIATLSFNKEEIELILSYKGKDYPIQILNLGQKNLAINIKASLKDCVKYA